jgi:hypothetical protein
MCKQRYYTFTRLLRPVALNTLLLPCTLQQCFASAWGSPALLPSVQCCTSTLNAPCQVRGSASMVKSTPSLYPCLHISGRLKLSFARTWIGFSLPSVAICATLRPRSHWSQADCAAFLGSARTLESNSSWYSSALAVNNGAAASASSCCCCCPCCHQDVCAPPPAAAAAGPPLPPARAVIQGLA